MAASVMTTATKSKIHTSEVDNQLAAHDLDLGFCDRLCLVKTISQKNVPVGDVEPDQEVATYKLWPALKFDSHKELMDQIRMIKGIKGAGRLLTKITVEWTRQRRTNRAIQSPEAHGIAYLFGRDGAIVLVPKTTSADGERSVEIDDVTIFDFFSRMLEMEAAEGHCGTPKFQSAFKLALRRMEDSMEDEGEFDSEEEEADHRGEMILHSLSTVPEQSIFRNMPPASPVRRRNEKAVELSTITSGRKTFSNLEYSPMLVGKKQSKGNKTATAQKRPPSPRKKSMKKSMKKSQQVREDLMMEAEESVPVKNVEYTEMDEQDRGSLLSSPEKPSPGKEIPPDEKTVSDDAEPTNEAEEDTSEDADESLIGKRNVQRSSPAPVGDILWPEMYRKMKDDGWVYLEGRGLIEWIYIHPLYAHMNKTELFKKGTEDKDYFLSEQSLKRYARVHLGWKTEDVSSVDSPKEVELAERIKKRKRGVQQAAEAVEVAKPAAKPKPAAVKPVETSKAKAAKGKKQSKQANVPDTPIDLAAARARAGKAKKQAAKKTLKVVIKVAKPEPTEDPSSPESTESEEGSRFSDTSSVPVSVSKRTRSKIDTPTISEMEAGLGVQRSAKQKQATKKLSFHHEEAQPASQSTADCEGASKSETSDSANPSEESSEDATYQLMKSVDAWKLLMSIFGFTYSGTKYCLPGKENKPGKDSAAVEGENYFGSLAELRRNLCMYGLPEAKPNKFLDDEEAIDVDRWVRYANVSGLADAAFINPSEIGEVLGHKESWAMLKKLGLRYSGGNYMVAHHSDPSGDNFRFENPQGYLLHLAKFGIPRVEGICQNEVLSKDERFKLDLFITNTYVDTFKRINPGSEEAHEITPRRARRGAAQASMNESALATRAGRKASTPPPVLPSKQTTKHRKFQMEFNEMKIQRTFPGQLIGSQNALSILVDCYNFSVLERDGKQYFCLPNVGLTEDKESMLGCDYFESLQDMRENLCAYGLPPMAKGSKLTETQMQNLHYWVRCANIAAHCVKATVVPECVDIKPKKVRTILKSLGYTFSDKTSQIVLPEVSFHNSTLGTNRFDKVIDLFNHIARFGLAAGMLDGKLSAPEKEGEERLQLEVFVASRATFDVCERIKCNNPIMKKSPGYRQEETDAVAPLEAKALNTAQDVAPDALSKRAAPNTPTRPAAVVENEAYQDTPESSPQKKQKTNTMFKYLTNPAKEVGDAGDAFSPQELAKSSPVPSELSRLSSSCLDEKGDEDVEACFLEPPECDTPAKALETVQQSQSDEVATLDNQMTMAHQTSDLENDGVLMHFPQAEDPRMAWSALWTQMKKAGWKYSVGDGLIAWYWIHPVAAKLKKSEMLQQCREGVHYFTTDHDLHQYAMDNLGWAGGQVVESLAIQSDVSMISKVKKRKQTNDTVNDVALSPPKRSRAPTEGSNSESESSLQDSSQEHEKILFDDEDDSDVDNLESPEFEENDDMNESHDDDESLPSPTTEENQEAIEAPLAESSAVPETSDDIIVEDSQLAGEEEQALPDQEPTVRDKLECCQMVLHPSFKKNQLSKSLCSKSTASSNEDDIIDFMTKSIETGNSVNEMTLPSPGFLYICGGPGTGKTTAVTSCADERTKWATCNDHEKPIFCVINMASSHLSNGKDGIMRVMLRKIAKSLGIDGDSKLAIFETQFKKKTVVLILDEIDMMFKQHGGIAEGWFRTLVEWAEIKDMRFSMIGISNCVNDANATRIRELGHSPRELVFSAYKEEDLLAILEQRLGKNIVDPKALELISRRVATASGDARRALEISSNAVEKCKDSLTDEKLDRSVGADDECMPLVKLPHMMRAIREAMPMRHADVICTLPQAAKVILCIAVSLSQVWGPTAEISMSTLKNYCVQATHHAIMDELGVGQIMNLVVMLIDSGLFLAGNRGHFSAHDPNSKLKIGVQLDDVEIALEQSLLKEGGFYRGLVDYVKRECPRPGNP